MKTMILTLALLALTLVGAPGRAQREQMHANLVPSIRTTTLMRLVLALSPQRMPDLTPAVRSKALARLKIANRKIAAILDNPKLSDSKKKQRLSMVHQEGALSAGKELGGEVDKLKAGFISLKGDVFWDEPVYQAFPAEKLTALKRQLQAADVFGGSSGFSLSGWGDLGV